MQNDPISPNALAQQRPDQVRSALPRLAAAIDDPQWWTHLRAAAVNRAQDGNLDAAQRVEWSKVAGEAGRRSADLAGSPEDGQYPLRALLISQLGPDPGDPWLDPAALAAEVLAVLTLTPAEARAQADDGYRAPVERIRVLRVHKNLLGPLAVIAPLLADTDDAALVAEWLSVRPLLP